MLQKCLIRQKPTKTGEEVTGEMDEFLFHFSHVAFVQTSMTKQNLSISTVTSSVVFVCVLSSSCLNCADSFLCLSQFIVEILPHFRHGRFETSVMMPTLLFADDVVICIINRSASLCCPAIYYDRD